MQRSFMLTADSWQHAAGLSGSRNLGCGHRPRQEGQAAESSMDPCIRAFAFLITSDMSVSGIPSLTIDHNQEYPIPELMALNEDFEYTYRAANRKNSCCREKHKEPEYADLSVLP